MQSELKKTRSGKTAPLYHRWSVLMAAILAMTVAAPAKAADFQTGLQAFRAGDMQRALAEWEPLARSGRADAQHALGMMHEYGRGLNRDDAQAIQWYEKAARQNYAEAQYRLGVLHENGWGVVPDPAQAVTWYARAADLGHVFAQHDLAFMYLHGTGVARDKVEAYKWLKIAETQRADVMTKHLKTVSDTMTPAQIAKAESRARMWLDSQKL